MRSSHCARGKDSAGAAYFLSPLATAPVAQSSEIRAATEPALQARLAPGNVRPTLHCGLRIPDLRARNHSPLRRSCHHAVPAICLTRRSPAQRIRRCGLNATFRTRLQRCDGDWWPLLPRRSHVAHAAPLGTDTKICDTVRLILLSQKVAADGEENHLLARFTSQRWGGWNGSAEIKRW